MNIVENNDRYLSDFVTLNEEWISKYFEIEDIDKKLAKNPEIIIENDGYIFSLLDEDKVVGVCALFNEGNGVYELARMAVTTKHQGKGYGNKLMEACILKLKDINANRVYVVSNTKLEAAVSLYKKYGFTTISNGPHPVYSRANILLEMKVT